MTALVLDIETTALASSLGLSYPDGERNPPSTWKDPAKIAEWRERDREKWTSEIAKTAALNPRLGRIVCVGWDYAQNGVTEPIGPFALAAQTERAEAGLIAQLWARIGEANGQIITFNGLSFDIPWLLFRSMVNGVKPTVPVKTLRDWTRRYSYSPHMDLRAVLTNWDNRATGTLTDWATCLGIPCADTTKGSDIHALYQAGDFDAIAEHCRADVQTTKQLYQRVSAIYGEI